MKDTERDDLFRQARGGGAPTSEERARVRAAVSRKLGVAVGAAVGATAAAKTSASIATASAAIAPAAAAVPPAAVVVAGVSALGLAKGVAVVALAVVVGYAALPTRHAAPAPAATEVVVVSPSSPTLPSSSLPTPVLAQANEPLPASPPVSVAKTARVAAGPSAAAMATSGEELSLVTAMQLALRNGENAKAKDLVREHERRFPMSAWAEEREGARVLATCADGAGPDTRRLGEAFLRTYPLSPLGARVRAACQLEERER